MSTFDLNLRRYNTVLLAAGKVRVRLATDHNADTPFALFRYRPALLGRAVQVDPINPMLKAPGTNHLTLKYVKTAFNFCFQIILALLHLDEGTESALNSRSPPIRQLAGNEVRRCRLTLSNPP